MTEKEILIAFLGKTLNLPSDKIAELLYKKSDDGQALTDELLTEALDNLTRSDAERVAKLKPNTKDFFDNGYKKAQSEVSEKFEKQIREKFAIPDDVPNTELLDAAFAVKSSKKDDDVKAHPLFIQREKEYAKALAEAKAQGETALEQFKAEQAKKMLVSSAKDKARDILTALKPVLEENPTVAKRRVENFLREFDNMDFERLENGDFVPIREGKRVENEHAHAISFDQFVAGVAAEHFTFPVQDPKGNGGNKTAPTGTQAPGQTPANEAELWKAYNAAKPEERGAILDAYEKAHGQIDV